MQKRKLQVFVSSTYLDLKDDRQAAVAAILRAGHIPAGMELFNAGDQEQWEVIKRWINESDVYVLILGGRYGSIEPKSKKSYTQLEYEYARDAKKPFLSVVIDESELERRVKLYGSQVKEQDNPQKLKAFRSTVEKRMVTYFRSEAEIKYGISNALSELDALNPTMPGWIRGDQVANAATINEMAMLSAQNRQLLIRISELENRVPLIAEHDRSWLNSILMISVRGVISITPSSDHLPLREDLMKNYELTWSEILMSISGPLLISGLYGEILQSFTETIAEKEKAERSYSGILSFTSSWSREWDFTFKPILYELAMRGIIEPVKPGMDIGNRPYKLDVTSEGQKIFKYLRINSQ